MKSLIPGFFLKQGAVLVAILFAILAFTVLPFSSCSSAPTNTNMSASTVDTADDDDEASARRRTSGGGNDDPEDCDDDEGDPCKDDEACAAVCELIYEGDGSGYRSCRNRGDETVMDRLVKVHDILMGKGAGTTRAVTRSGSQVSDDLNKIKDDDDEDDYDVDHDDLKCYLQIGSQKYINEINKQTDIEVLIETLKWLVEDDKESAKIIYGLHAGDDILEALLLKMRELKSDGTSDGGKRGCIDAESPDWNSGGTPGLNNRPGISSTENRNIWDLDISAEEIIIWHGKSSFTQGKIELENEQDTKLYSALSCIYEKTSNQDIFSYSAEHDNQYMFDLAFDLLVYICDDVEKPRGHENIACARALLCRSDWRAENGGRFDHGALDVASGGTGEKHPNKKGDLWEEHAERGENKKYLTKSSGGSEYNECRLKDFADFF